MGLSLYALNEEMDHKKLRQRSVDATGIKRVAVTHWWVYIGEMGGDIKKVKIGISACLAGERVRYDGDHKLQSWYEELNSKYGCQIEWVIFCPELAMGMSVPRPTIGLYNEHNKILLKENDSGKNLDHLIQPSFSKYFHQFKDLSAFILKSKSPSCALKSAPINGTPNQYSDGVFTHWLKQQFPQILLVQETDLINPSGLEKFMARLGIK